MYPQTQFVHLADHSKHFIPVITEAVEYSYWSVYVRFEQRLLLRTRFNTVIQNINKWYCDVQ